MKFKTLCAALIGLVMSTGAFAQTTEIVDFRGGGFLTLKTDCTEFGWFPEGTSLYVTARHRPANVGGNDNRDRLSIFFSEFPYAMSLTVEGRLNKSFKQTDGISVGSTGFQVDTRTRARLNKRVPGNVTANTQTVRLQLALRNFDSYKGCEASLDVSLVRRP